MSLLRLLCLLSLALLPAASGALAQIPQPPGGVGGPLAGQNRPMPPGLMRPDSAPPAPAPAAAKPAPAPEQPQIALPKPDDVTFEDVADKLDATYDELSLYQRRVLALELRAKLEKDMASISMPMN